jgi:hypothetical protein
VVARAAQEGSMFEGAEWLGRRAPRLGSMTIGNGRTVKSVSWSKSRGFARHT